MHSLNSRGVHSENLRVFPNCATNNMDYRQKMVVPTPQKLKHEDDDDDDLEALRLAALKSLRAKHTLQSNQQPALLPQPTKPRAGYSCPGYKNQRQANIGFNPNRRPRQNGNTFYRRVNQNLIEIIPVEEEEPPGPDASQTDSKPVKTNIQEDSRDDSKFFRYKDNASSDEEDNKEANSLSLESVPSSNRVERGEESGTEKESRSGIEESPRPGREEISEEALLEEVEAPEEEEQETEDVEEEEEDEEDEEEQDEKPSNDDDDDVLLMADLEEEDSLERLMDEMEREMNVDKVDENKEKKEPKKEVKELKKTSDLSKARSRKSRTERESDRNGVTNAMTSSSGGMPKNELRSVSPRSATRILPKRRSHSPKPRLRKKSPRRSPRRSPPRKKAFREIPRTRSPRKLSPPRFSPRPRSPKLSPRGRSPNNRSPIRRTPPRKMSPRGRSPHSRSPRIRRSRSPRVISRSRSPGSRLMRSPKRSNRSRSPRIRSRSPRMRSRSPRARTPRSKSPRNSPVRTNSPRRSPRRLVASPRPRSPKLVSPERRRASPVRIRSPLRISPHRSPWSSPRNSPRLSPRRRRSPKESSRKTRRSVTPEEPNYKREASPPRKVPSSPENPRSKIKKESLASTKESESNNDPVLEARRRKFESTRPIDPVHDNKKIKLGKKESSRSEVTEEPSQIDSPKIRKGKVENEFPEEDDDVPETDLCLTDDYVYEVLEDVVSDDSSSAGNAVPVCVEMVPVKVEKTRSKKKKKRDKEIYQVGKLKVELPLSERIGKEKKCKKRKDRGSSPVESSPEQTVVEDLTVDEEEADLRTQLSRRRAERLNRTAPIQSARLLQSAFKGVVNEVAKTNAKGVQRHSSKGEDKKNNAKEVRRVTVLHRPVTDLPDSEDETAVDSKVPIRFRLGLNKTTQENSRESKPTRKSSKRQSRKA